MELREILIGVFLILTLIVPAVIAIRVFGTVLYGSRSRSSSRRKAITPDKAEMTPAGKDQPPSRKSG